MTALIALLVLVPSLSALGHHAGPESVSASKLDPTTIYKSEHRSGGDEVHLHAEIGFESITCLACFTSLRNQVLLGGESAAAAVSDLGAFTPTSYLRSPAAPPALAFSSRAPPRA
jgi:hypothetical protein